MAMSRVGQENVPVVDVRVDQLQREIFNPMPRGDQDPKRPILTRALWGGWWTQANSPIDAAVCRSNFGSILVTEVNCYRLALALRVTKGMREEEREVQKFGSRWRLTLNKCALR